MATVVGLATALAALALGCEQPASESDLRTEGPIEIREVFVTSTALDDLALGWIEAGTEIDTDNNGVNDVVVTDAVVTGLEMRIILDELAQGRTVEQFVCECNTSFTTSDDCGGDPAAEYSLDPSNCLACGDNPTTLVDETGSCLDADMNGVPDDVVLLPGLVTVTCPGLTWTSAELDGWYDPSGNQLVPVGNGIRGVGPALNLTLPVILPTNTTCNVALSPTILDKDGNAAVSAPDVAFTTAPLAVTTTSPVDEAEAVNPISFIRVSFSAPVVDPPATSIAVTYGTAATAVAGSAQNFGAGSVAFAATLGALPAGEAISVTVNGTDAFGGGLAAPFTFGFTTAPLAVEETTPADGATNVNVDRDIEVVFNTLVVDTVAISVSDGTSTVAGTTVVADDTATWSITSGSLAANTAYTVTVSGIEDLYGITLANQTFDFTTAP